MGCDDGSCSNGSCGSGCSGKDKDGLPPGMLSEYDLNIDTNIGTLVLVETSENSISRDTAKLISRLRTISDDRIFGAIFGPGGTESLYGEAFSYGVDTLYHVKCSENTDVEAISDTLKDICDRINPMAVCISGTEKGNATAEKTAFKLGKPLMKDGTEISLKNGSYVSDAQTDFVPMFAKHNRFPLIMTFKPGSFSEPISDRNRSGTVINRPLVKRNL